MFKFLILLTILKTVVCLKEDLSLIKSETVDISLRFKSVKCTFFDPNFINLTKCYVKAVSRNVSTMNILYQITQEWKAPVIVFYATYTFN
jgi:hypothetical protein